MTTIVGIKTKEGVVLGSDKRASKGFFIGSKITQKIAKIDDTLAVAIAWASYQMRSISLKLQKLKGG